jgi:hypothetical protein
MEKHFLRAAESTGEFQCISAAGADRTRYSTLMALPVRVVLGRYDFHPSSLYLLFGACLTQLIWHPLDLLQKPHLRDFAQGPNIMAGRVTLWIALIFSFLGTASVLLFLLPGLIQSMPADLWLVTVSHSGDFSSK